MNVIRSLIRNCSDHKKVANIFHVLKDKNCQPLILKLVKLPFRNEGEIQTFSNEGKLKECVSIIPTLKEQVKEALHKRFFIFIKMRVILGHQERKKNRKSRNVDK